MHRYTSTLILFFLAVPPLLIAQSSRIDFRFDFVRRQAEAMGRLSDPVPATIRFLQHPDEALLEALERSGVRFEHDNGRRLGSRTVYPAEFPLSLLPILASVDGIAAVQPCWRPVRVPPLDVSRPQIQADTVWQRNDQRGRKITGKGVLIADFDTGVDIFNPMLWFADGDTLNWIDVNTNGAFDPGKGRCGPERERGCGSGRDSPLQGDFVHGEHLRRL